MGLVRAIHKLTRTFGFAKFEFVEFELFNFEVGSSIGFELKWIKPNLNYWATRENLTGLNEINRVARPSNTAHVRGPPDEVGPACL